MTMPKHLTPVMHYKHFTIYERHDGQFVVSGQLRFYHKSVAHAKRFIDQRIKRDEKKNG